MSDEAKRELNKDLLERGQQALLSALGPHGAMLFLRESAALSRTPKEDDGAKRVLMAVEIVGEELTIRFSQPTTWLRYSPAEAKDLANVILERVRYMTARGSA